MTEGCDGTSDDAPLASVVIPAWNRVATIGRAVGSVLRQTEPNVQVIVVDNGSTDRTVAAVEVLGDPRVLLVRSESNLGPSAGRNLGAAHATAPLLGFLDSDDELDERWVEVLSTALSGDPSAVFVSCGYRVLPIDGSGPYDMTPTPLGPAHYGARGAIQAGTFLVRTSTFRALGGYVDELRFGENTEFGLRVARHCHQRESRMVALDDPLLRWHQGPWGRYGEAVEARYESAEYMLANFHDQLSLDPVLLAAHFTLAGVYRARHGDLAVARRHLRSAALTDPSVRRYARALAAWVPPVSARLWPTRS